MKPLCYDITTGTSGSAGKKPVLNLSFIKMLLKKYFNIKIVLK